jgi:hypothetical protein
MTTATDTILNAFEDSNNIEEFLNHPDIIADNSTDNAKRSLYYSLANQRDARLRNKPNFGERRFKNVFDAIKTQEDSGIPTITDQIIKLSDAEKLLFDGNGKLNSMLEIWEKIKSGAEGFIENQALLYLKERNGLLEEINTKTSLTGELSKDYRDELQRTGGELVLIGVGLDEVVNASTNLISQTGKFRLLNQETWVEGAKVAKAYIGSIDDFTNSVIAFEKIGYGANDTSKFLETVAKSSIGVGIESRRVTKDLRENIGKLNEFGFKNGVQGLGEMIKKSIEFRTNMKSTFDVAEKLFSFNGALEMSANLQVLGGAIGDFADPLKLVHLAINDINGLQDAIIGASQGLAVYNSEQGRFEITGANMLIARDRADALKIDYAEFANMTIAQNERIMASRNLLGAKIKGKFIDDDLKEFLTNMAQMDKGELKIGISQDLKKEFKEFKELDEDNKISLKDISKNEKLLEKFEIYQNEIKGMSKEDIIKNQASSVKNIERYVSFLVATARIKGGQAIGNLADAYGIKLVEQIKEVSTNFTKSKYGTMFNEGVVKAIGKISGMDSKEIREILNGETLAKEKVAKEKEAKEQANKKEAPIARQELTVLIKNDGAVLDAITREIAKDPNFAKSIMELMVQNNNNNNNVKNN